MEKTTKTNFLTILNDKGLHTRPATELVKCVSKFESEIYLKFQDLRINAKSLLGILMLAAPKGSKIEIEAEGFDGTDAIDALQTLAKNKFYMSY
jgi:phosphocarrier protein HPr